MRERTCLNRRRILCIVTGVLLLSAVALIPPMARRMVIAGRMKQIHTDVRALSGAIVGGVAYDFCGMGRPPATRVESPAPNQPRWTFRLHATWDPEQYESIGTGDELATLTTPFSYLLEYPRDPFTGEMYGYWTGLMEWGDWEGSTSQRISFVITSAGPDEVHDLDERDVWVACYNMPPRMRFNGSRCEWTGISLPLTVLNSLYDPTNGLSSRGDIVFIHGGLSSVNLASNNPTDWASW